MPIRSPGLLTIGLAIAASCRTVAAAEVSEPAPFNAAAYVIEGPITQATASDFARWVATQPGGARWVVVDSPGGDVEAALHVAALMQAERVSIYVLGLCASSCANYLFTAAKLKVIGPGAIVGWHGSPASEHLGGLSGLAPAELAQAKKLAAALVRRERALLATSGVDPRLLCAGDRTIEKAEALGWTMPIDAMAGFGLRSVFALGREPIPTHVSGHRQPVVVIAPERNCEKTYPLLPSASYRTAAGPAIKP